MLYNNHLIFVWQYLPAAEPMIAGLSAMRSRQGLLYGRESQVGGSLLDLDQARYGLAGCVPRCWAFPRQHADLAHRRPRLSQRRASYDRSTISDRQRLRLGQFHGRHFR
jgi:hypothetical protein